MSNKKRIRKLSILLCLYYDCSEPTINQPIESTEVSSLIRHTA